MLHMAALSSAFWGWDDHIGLTTMTQRIRFFAPDNIAAELTAAQVPTAIAAAAAGWRALPDRSPMMSRLARLVHDRPEVITGPLSGTPRTFLAGDWKMGNLGTHPDGRTILLDWALPGAGPACWDLCWYLALNQARLPEPKEAAIGRFRAALEHHGIGTGNWWQQQLDLCMIGIMATFGWEKALGDPQRAVLVGGGGRRRGRPPGHPGSGIADDRRPQRRPARRWALGAELVCAPIAAELVSTCLHPLGGRTVPDAGASTTNHDPARAGVAVARDFGWRVPGWYTERKGHRPAMPSANTNLPTMIAERVVSWITAERHES
jgi:hypothetical protein